MKNKNQKELEPWQEKLVLLGRKLQSQNDKKTNKDSLENEKSPQ